MAKKRASKPKPVPAPAKRRRPCFTCAGSGQVCVVCGESEPVCDCDDQDLADCEDCIGTGITSADIEESDLRGDVTAIATWKNRHKGQ